MNVKIAQNVAILVDGNNIERSLHKLYTPFEIKRDKVESIKKGNITTLKNVMIDFDKLVPNLIGNRALGRLVYFREGADISSKLAERLHENFHGRVVPCHKSADIPLTIYATQIADKVDTIIILSGDSDYVELVRFLRSRGVRVEIAAVKDTTAKILKDEADYFTPLTKEDLFIFKRTYTKRTNTRKHEKGNNNSTPKAKDNGKVDKGPQVNA